MRNLYKNECKLFGRNLKEYLRGERIYDLLNPKPRLLDSIANV